MRWLACTIALAGCNQLLGNGDFHTGGDGGARDAPADADPCAAQSLPSTTVSGTVFAPNGTLPIYNAAVYIPTSPLAPISTTVGPPTCASGSPPLVVHTDTAGHFQLGRIPATATELVIQVGKWRREIQLPAIQACADNPIDAAKTRLPSTGAEGNMPQIAVTTGAADAIECLLRDIGIADSEFVAGAAGAGHVHLYLENGVGKIGTTTLPASSTLFTSTELAAYDIALFGCPGQPSPDATPTATPPVKAWADAGGWLFITHYGYQWLVAGPTPWPMLGTFTMNAPPTGVTTVSLDTTQTIGQMMSSWLVSVGASTTPGQFPLVSGTGRNSCSVASAQLTARRMYLDPMLNAGVSGVQSFTWDAMAGGRVTFDDVHVSGAGGTPTQVFPTECTGTMVTPQEKALMFQLFETPTCAPM